METYYYYLYARPAGYGAQPTNGLIYARELNPHEMIPSIRRGAYALLEYTRELTRKEMRDYEILPQSLPQDVEYRGFVFEYQPVQDEWKVYEQGDFDKVALAFVETVDEAKSAIDEYLGRSGKECKK